MANVGDLVAISRVQRFQDRVNYYLNKAAVDVMAEAANTAQHSQRVQFARTVLNGGGPTILQVAIDVMGNSTIAAEAVLATTPDYEIPDSDIAFTINSLFNALAGVAL